MFISWYCISGVLIASLNSGNQLITRKLKLIREFYFPCDGNKVKQFRINFISVTKVAKGALLIHTDCTCPCVFWAHSFVEKIHLQYIYLAERIPLTHFRTGLEISEWVTLVCNFAVISKKIYPIKKSILAS